MPGKRALREASVWWCISVKVVELSPLNYGTALMREDTDGEVTGGSARAA